MPKWPCSSGPVRNELRCCTVITNSLCGRMDPIGRGVAGGAHERPNLVRVLHSGRALNARGDIDAGSARKAYRLADIAGIQSAGQHERHTGLKVLQKAPVE